MNGIEHAHDERSGRGMRIGEGGAFRRWKQCRCERYGNVNSIYSCMSIRVGSVDVSDLHGLFAGPLLVLRARSRVPGYKRHYVIDIVLRSRCVQHALSRVNDREKRFTHYCIDIFAGRNA